MRDRLLHPLDQRRDVRQRLQERNLQLGRRGLQLRHRLLAELDQRRLLRQCLQQRRLQLRRHRLQPVRDRLPEQLAGRRDL